MDKEAVEKINEIELRQKVWDLFGKAYQQGAHTGKTKRWMTSDTEEVFELFEQAGYRKQPSSPPPVLSEAEIANAVGLYSLRVRLARKLLGKKRWNELMGAEEAYYFNLRW